MCYSFCVLLSFPVVPRVGLSSVKKAFRGNAHSCFHKSISKGVCHNDIVNVKKRIHVRFPMLRDTTKVSKGAKIRNRYNQVPHLTQDTNGKVTNSQ